MKVFFQKKSIKTLASIMLAFFTIIHVFSMVRAIPPSIITISSSADSGAGTLREALSNVQANDTIIFSPSTFPPSNPATINLQTQLPDIVANGVTIDASDAGIILNGSNLPETWNDCLVVNGADHVLLMGLQFHSCPDHGLEVRGNTSNLSVGGRRDVGNGPTGQGNQFVGNVRGLWIENVDGFIFKGNIVGLDVTGLVAQRNLTAGITIRHTDNIVIGGPSVSEGNWISGNGVPTANYSYGLEVWYGSNIHIEGNNIGTDASGSIDLGNAHEGILIVDSQDVLLKGNLISGNDRNGAIFDRVHHVTVQGNSIGTNLAGTATINNNGLGLRIVGSDFQIGGLGINDGNLLSGNGDWAALSLQGTPTSTAIIQGNFVGTNRTGTAPLGNLDTGIQISGTNVLLGGSSTNASNLISGNDGHGVYIESGVGSISVTVKNNYIGTDMSGDSLIENGFAGVVVRDFDNAFIENNTINGSAEWAGLSLIGSGNANAAIKGNKIGTNVLGNNQLGNLSSGIYVTGTNAIIGGESSIDANIVAGNGSTGIHVEGAVSNNLLVTILNNKIGVNRAGSQEIPNTHNGIYALRINTLNILGNVISGNGENGMYIDGDSQTTTFICGNKVGTDAIGQETIGNGANGVVVNNATAIVGDMNTCEGNIISANNNVGLIIEYSQNALVQNNMVGVNRIGAEGLGNNEHGIFLRETSDSLIAYNTVSDSQYDGIVLAQTSSNNIVRENMIGTDSTGLIDFGNRGRGVAIYEQSHDNQIIDNLISGNSDHGVVIHDVGTDHNKVIGNIIGTNIYGNERLSNSGSGVFIIEGAYNVIGGTSPIERNIISGNHGTGISIVLPTATNNTVVGNFIGVNISGTQAISNWVGIGLFDGASENRIGGNEVGERNIISGNDAEGINVIGYANEVNGNYIGTDVNGTSLIGNGRVGLALTLPSEQQYNAGQNIVVNNVIVGSGQVGECGSGMHISSSGNQVKGNHIGVDVTGSLPLPNYCDGIGLAGASNNVIGGSSPQDRNIISGNRGNGVAIFHDLPNDIFSESNLVQGNYIGTDITGRKAIGNMATGVFVSGYNNTIGGTAEMKNLISGNGQNGVVVSLADGDVASSNKIQSNYIGTDISGDNPLPNGDSGIALWDGVNNNLVGGSNKGNLIAFNRDFGVFAGLGAGNQLIANTVYRNEGVAIRATVNTKIQENVASENGVNRIEMPADSIVGSDQTWTPQGTANTFFIFYTCDACELVVPINRTLTVDAGTIVRLDYNREVVVNGSLYATGNEEKPVIFTGPSESIWSGDWDGIRIESGGLTDLTYTRISYADNGLTVAGDASIQFSVLAANREDGLRVLEGGTVALHDNSFAGNRGYDIANLSSEAINADNSWWGANDAPISSRILGQVQIGQINNGQNDVNNNWTSGQLLSFDSHEFVISSHKDFDWYLIPVMDANQLLQINLTNLPTDYDMFLFSHLNEFPEQGIQDLGQVMNLDRLDSTGQLKSLPQLMQIGQIFGDANQDIDTGQLVSASTNPFTQPEVISFSVGNQIGWYYLLVAGNNGTSRPNQPYTLQVELAYHLDESDNYLVPTFNPLTSTYPSETLIVTNFRVLEENYGQDSTEQLMEYLAQLSVHPEVEGQILDLATYELVDSKYISWTNEITSVYKANLTAATIKSLLSTYITSYPNLKYILIVGNDEVVPHWRAFDETPTANERSYNSYTVENSSIGRALEQGFYLTDDFYGDFNPVGWRGRELYIPQYGLGRLLETPDEMIAVISGFLTPTVNTNDTALITGYDFLKDQAEVLEHELQNMTVITLVNDYWSSEDLRQEWTLNKPDFVALNAHFSHWEAVPADYNLSDHFSPNDITSDYFDSTGNLIYSVGCHSGLCVPDGQALDNYGADFCQAFSRYGNMYIANTGYGFGDVEVIGYSELLSILFLRHVKAGLPIGLALSEAKAKYYLITGSNSFSPYDEKTMSQVVLYGLPMYQFELPTNLQSVANLNAPPDVCSITPIKQSGMLTTRQVSCEIPADRFNTESGDYFAIHDAVETNMGQPIQPRTSIAISTTGTVAHGAFFEGGEYDTFVDFDPVITGIITDGSSLANEPLFTSNIWLPAHWDIINSIRKENGWYQNLVIVPAQYQSTSPYEGIERVFTTMTYTVYYSNESDRLVPSIWQVIAWDRGDSTEFRVEVTDYSGISRVGITYLEQEGHWQTFDLTQSSSDPSLWIGELTLLDDNVEFFIQAVDMAGNIAVDHNKGQYYNTLSYSLFMPIIVR